MNNKIVKYFGTQEVTFIEKDNQLYLTAEELGKALGYSEPRKGVIKVFERHRDILANFSVDVKLTTTGGKKDVTAFNELGCNIIAMKSNTKKSDEFVVWAAGIITEYRHGLLVKKGPQPQQPLRAKFPPASLLAEMRKLKLDGLSITIWLNDNYNFPISPSLIVLTALKEMKATEKDVKDLIKKFGYKRDIQFWIDINKGTLKEKDRLATVLGLTTKNIWRE
jgi:prophage antirepressor-like protein